MYSLAGDAGLGDTLGLWEFVVRAIPDYRDVRAKGFLLSPLGVSMPV